MEVNGQFYTPAALFPGKSPRYLLYRKLDRPRSRFWTLGEEKSLFFLPGIEPRRLGHPAPTLVIIWTELFGYTNNITISSSDSNMTAV
jgi:hypothetical protein